MKAYTFTHNLSIRWRLASRFGMLAPGMNPWYPLHRRLGWSQSRSRPSGEKKSLLPMSELEYGFLCRPAHFMPLICREVTQLLGFLFEITGLKLDERSWKASSKSTSQICKFAKQVGWLSRCSDYATARRARRMRNRA
jgi:hypothetical protein